jgi:hypothetical protein
VNPSSALVQAALGSILRWLLALGAGYLIKAGIWNASDAQTYVAAGTVAGLTLGWSLWQKWKAHHLSLWQAWKT